jgi:hypothetical protein
MVGSPLAVRKGEFLSEHTEKIGLTGKYGTDGGSWRAEWFMRQGMENNEA